MQKLLEIFNSFSTVKKITLFALLVISVSALSVLFLWANKPDYQLLFSNLNQKDASSIISKLKEEKINYKIGPSGAISVPAEVVYETRLRFAGEGLTMGGGVGFEIFDKTGFGVTEFVQKVNYNRAIQGELARTVSSLDEVESARIHIVVPEKRLFANDSEPASASVVLNLKPGVTLKQNQIKGIVNLIAGSVALLNTKDVTILDSSGNLLTKSVEDDDQMNMTSTQLEYQRLIEKGFEKRIQSILNPVVGFGKVIAKVSAEIDFKRIQKTEESYDPDSVVIRSEQKNSEKTYGAGSGGVPGVVSNVPNRNKGARGNSSQSGSEIKNETFNYEISKTISTTIEPSGVVKRLSVAVLVDGSYKKVEAEDGTISHEYIARNKEDLEKFTSLASSAVGLTVKRGDTIEVLNIPFETQFVDETPVEMGLFEKYIGKTMNGVILRYATILIIALLILFFVLRPLIKGVLALEPRLESLPLGAGEGGGTPSLPPEALAALQEGGAMPQDALAALKEGGATDQQIAKMTKEAMGMAPIEDSPAVLVKKSIKDMVKENPQAASQVVKRWIQGREDGD